MESEILLTKIRSAIIGMLPTNESIVWDIHAYNDVVQGFTYMAFTQNRIFY